MADIVRDRKYVAELLKNVRLGYCSVRQAMQYYPKDTQDESLIASYHALIHYEADEDIRRQDPEYSQEQDDYIDFLIEILSMGDTIPQNIIQTYKSYYKTAPILHEAGFKGFLKSFFKNLNIIK